MTRQPVQGIWRDMEEEFIERDRGEVETYATHDNVVPFNMIWGRIKEFQGETFRQIRGGEFTYKVVGAHIAPDRTNQNIPRAHLELAAGLLPLRNTVPLQHLRGPSFIYAILMDQRIRGKNESRGQ